MPKVKVEWVDTQGMEVLHRVSQTIHCLLTGRNYFHLCLIFLSQFELLPRPGLSMDDRVMGE